MGPDRPVIDNPAVIAAVSALLQGETCAGIACTGAGAGIANLIWQVPGASRLLVAYDYPYHRGVFNLLVGRDWAASGQSYCSPAAAAALAQASYLKVQQALFETGGPPMQSLIGVGLTAAAATARHLRGGTRFHAAVRTAAGTALVSATMDQETVGRVDGGAICDLTVLNLILQAAGLEQIATPDAPCLEAAPSDCLDPVSGTWRPQPWQPDLTGLAAAPVLIGLDGRATPAGDKLDRERHIIYPGSFNPVHFAHDANAAAIRQLTGKEPVFEISANNADKAAVDDGELARRASQMAGRWPVILARDLPRFVDKVRRYNGCSFLVGADTALRVLDPRFYPAGADGVRETLQTFAAHGAKFYVSPRLVDGQLVTCDRLPVADEFRGLFIPVSGRWDVSSTQLRSARS